MDGTTTRHQISIDFASILRILVVLGVLYILVSAHNLILVFLTAVVISSFIESPVNYMKKYNVPRLVTVIGLFCLVSFFISFLLYFLIPVLFSEVSSLVNVLNKFIPEQSFLHSFDTTNVATTKKLFTSISNNAPLQQVVSSANSFLFTLSGGTGETLSYLFGGLFNIVLVGIMSFYLSVQERGIENLLRIITPKNNEQYVTGLWNRVEKKIGLWFQGQIILGLIVGLTLYIFLTIFGIEYALILALLAFVFELIPFGLILATIPAVVFAYAQGGLFLVFMIGVIYFIVGQIEAYFIAPIITKRMIGVPPILMILSVLIGGQLAGAWGVILAIPVSVFLLEYIEDLEKSKK